MKYVIDTITPTDGVDYVYVMFLADDGKVLEKHCLPYDATFEKEIQARFAKCESAATVIETKKKAIEAIMTKAGATKG
jgi:hypothetical protein